MPVLAANQVSLAEVLEVKGGPLSEEEIWAVLCQAGNELEDVLAKGKGKNHGQPSLFISPESLILSYSGHVKVSSSFGREKYKNPTYRAPELNLIIVPPSDGAVEKMYVYSLGMTVYYAAEYALAKSKMAHLSVSLGNLLLSMCEELARARFTLRQVLHSCFKSIESSAFALHRRHLNPNIKLKPRENATYSDKSPIMASLCRGRKKLADLSESKACGSKYSQSSYTEIIRSLVVLVLGNNVPEIIPDVDISPSKPLRRSYSADNQHPSRGIRSRYGSSLELPSPPRVQRVTHGQTTAAELVGNNERSLTTPDEQPSYHSPNKFMTKIPHTLDKYRKYLGKARSKKSESVTSPVVADRSIELKNRYGQYGTVPLMHGRHSHGSAELRSPRRRSRRAQSYHEGDDKGYEEGPFNGLQGKSRSEKLHSGRSLGNHYKAPSCDASSETSSLSDNHVKSTLSSAPSSSLVSLMEGSYQPESTLNDHGSDYWGSMGSLGAGSGLGQSGDWHHSSLGDLRSVSQQGNTDDDTKYSNGFGHMKRWSPGDDGERKYRSEQNLASPSASENTKKQGRSPRAKLRRDDTVVKKFFGPEFIQVSEDPNKSLVNITPKKDQKRVSGRRMITVEMLNKQRLEMAVESSTTVLELFTQVTKYMGLVEKIYFGLARLEEDEYFFLDFDKKLSKYAPPGWKEQSKKSTTKFLLYFKVKFYIESLSLHRHQETTHQFYLQLRNDLIYGQLRCDDDTVLDLASLVLQAEYGDYDKKKFGDNYFTPQYYVPHRVLANNEDTVCQKLRALHKIQCNLDQDVAEVKFIKGAQKIPEYGMHIYKAQWNKKENHLIYLGLCVRGVTVYEPHRVGKKVVETHSWQMIKKLAFKKKKFIIIPRTEDNVEKEKKITFYCTSYKRSKYLLYMCTSFHRFQMRMKVRLLTMDEPAKVLGAEGKRELSSHLFLNGNDESHITNGTVKNGDFDSSDDDESLPSRKSSVIGHDDGNGWMIEENQTPDHVVDGHPTLPYIIDSNSTPLKAHSEGSPSSKQAVEKRISDVILSPDRQVRAIKLRKDTRGAIGLTVVGGEDTQRLHFGIFIKRISPGSVAENDGRLEVGDRILAVNGKSLEYVSHDEAVQTLKNASVDVELLVSQSVRTDSHIDAAVLITPSPLEKRRARSPSRDERSSPYLVEDEPSPVRNDGNRSDDNHYVNIPPPIPTPPAYSKPHKPHPTTSDMALSTPSSPGSRSRGRHYGGVKLPGMDDGVLHGVTLKNRQFLNSGTSKGSEGSPGSIASFVDKVNCQESVPGAAEDDHKVSLGTASLSNASLGNVSLGNVSLSNAPDDENLTRSRSNSGVARPGDKIGNGPSFDTGRDNEVRSNSGSRPRTPSGAGFQILEQKNSDGTLGHLPVGVVWDNNERRSSEERNTQPKHFTVELTKESGSLGLNVTGGINTSVKDGAIYVKSLYPNGPADLDGQIQVGHKIISVNGISLQGVTHKQAVETIKRAPVKTVLVVENPPLEESSSSGHLVDGSLPKRAEEKASVFEVVLMKGLGGLGMSLVGGIDYSEQYGVDLRIKAMFPGQPAENSDQLRVGDIILAANGVGLQGKTNREAIDVLRDQPSRVVLLVKRDPASIPASLLRRGSFSQNIDPNEVLSAIHSKIIKEDSQKSEQSTYSTNTGHEASGGEGVLQAQDSFYSVGGASVDSRDGDRIIDGESPQGTLELGVRSGEQPHSHAALIAEDDHGFPPPPDDAGYPLAETVDREEYGEGLARNDGKEGDREDVVGLSTAGARKEKLAPDEEIIDLVLHKGSSGLGFTLAGGADTMGGCFVREIIGDPARSEGTLRAKDQIVMVNGQDTTNKKHMEAVNILRSTRNEVHLVIRRRPDKVKSQTKDGLNIKTVSMIRTTRGRIGLELGQDKHGQIYAEDVIPDEPAAKDGGLKRGDIILEINGKRIDDGDLAHAQECLDNAKPVVTVVIRQFRTETESKYMLNSPTESEQGIPDGLVINPTLTGQISPETPPSDHAPAELRPWGYPQEQDALHEGSQKSDNHVHADHTSGSYTHEVNTPGNYAQEKNAPENYIQERTTLEQYNQGETTPDKHSQVKSTHSMRESEIPPYEAQSSEDLPLGDVYNRRSFNAKYSRHGVSDVLESSERDTGIQMEFGEESDKEGHYSDVENKQVEDNNEDVGEETGGEAYQSDDDDDVILKNEVFVTTLEKGPRGLGFSLFSGRTINNTPGLFIRSIQPNSVVAENGEIIVGDQLLKVNDDDVETLNHNDVITMLRGLSGNVKLEMLRVQDGDDDEEEEDDEPSSSSYPHVLSQSPDVPVTEDNDESLKEDEGVVSTVTTPDFSEDLDIILNAIDQTKDDLPYSNKNSTESTSSVLNSEEISASKPPDNEKIPESWPEPPDSLQLAPVVDNSGGTLVITDEDILDYNDNVITNSEDDTTSVTFSEDGFLEELEDSVYTPSPDTEVKRPGVTSPGFQAILGNRTSSGATELASSPDLGNSGRSSGHSRIPIKPGSSLAKDVRFENSGSNGGRLRYSSASGDENIEMSVLKKDYSKGYLSTSRESTPRVTDGETVLGKNAPSESPLIPESFLDASQAISPSNTLSPEIPPPLPITPLPSDDDLENSLGSNPPSRMQWLQGMTMRERLEKVANETSVPKGRFDHPLRPKSPLALSRSPSQVTKGPLLELARPSERYSGECLKEIIKKLEQSLSSGKPADEYQELRKMKPIDNCPSGKRALNKEKNRYRNVLPYERTRVILSGDDQTDYINANYINIAVGSDIYHYIATQGPLPGTTRDFWKMIWEQKCQVIAMVAMDMESGKVKCHRYWPESPELPVKVNDCLEVQLESVETHNSYVQRLIKIKNIEDDECLDVVHLNFVCWPDHGVPKSASQLVDYIKNVRMHSSLGPCVVHCSAGIGRTGTMLTVDTFMKHIENGLEFNINNIVRNLREQRPGMIQTKDQYLFCYQSCLEMLKSLQA